ncbi:MAG: hypothetical protein LBV79_11025 [Candidatus Adiutrix sp.]|jgi:hypothetical protein|nr:hypothetical protein [Candidatus Adiutrix sp.]
MKKKYKSGCVDEATMRRFDNSCLVAVDKPRQDEKTKKEKEQLSPKASR